MKKGTIFFFAKTFLLIFFIILVLLTCALLIVILKFARPNIFKHSVTVVYETAKSEDALMSLLEMKENNITFRRAVYYAILQNTTTPFVYNGTDWIEINITSLAKKYLSGICNKGRYALFLTSGKDIYLEIIGKYNNFGKKSTRASVPLGGDKWLVLYLKNCLI